MTQPLRKGVFTIDDGTTVPGYHDGTYWNGWAKPLFKLEDIKAWLDATHNSYRMEGDKLIVDLEGNDPDYQEFTPVTIMTEDGELSLYEIDGWCWDEVEGGLTQAQIDRHDFVDNTIHEMIETLLGREVEWNMEVLGDIRQIVEEHYCETEEEKFALYPWIR